VWARGSIFSYTDARGVVHFTNVRTNDPRYEKITASSSKRRHRVPRRSDYDLLIGEVARAHAVPPALVKAVIAAESAFNPTAVSRAGAQGLMQLMPATADEMGLLDPFSATQNVQAGTGYLRQLMDRYGDVSRALAAYNAGPTAVDRYGGIPPYRETQAYVERVLTYYRSYHGDFTR
jgi:soluble lytic murein transglycosylase